MCLNFYILVAFYFYFFSAIAFFRNKIKLRELNFEWRFNRGLDNEKALMHVNDQKVAGHGRLMEMAG